VRKAYTFLKGFRPEADSREGHSRRPDRPEKSFFSPACGAGFCLEDYMRKIAGVAAWRIPTNSSHPAEREILQLVAEGKIQQKDVANTCLNFERFNTVETHRARDHAKTEFAQHPGN